MESALNNLLKDSSLRNYRARILVKARSHVTLIPPGGRATLYQGTLNLNASDIFYECCQPITVYWDEGILRLFYHQCESHPPPRIVYHGIHQTMGTMGRAWMDFIDNKRPCNFSNNQENWLAFRSVPMTVIHKTQHNGSLPDVKSLQLVLIKKAPQDANEVPFPQTRSTTDSIDTEMTVKIEPQDDEGTSGTSVNAPDPLAVDEPKTCIISRDVCSFIIKLNQ